MYCALTKNKYKAKIRTKLTVLIVLLCFIAISLLTEAFIVTHAAHDCAGDSCPTCAHIHSAVLLLGQFGKAAWIIAAIGICWLIVRIAPIPGGLHGIYASSLVDVKVRMNN